MHDEGVVELAFVSVNEDFTSSCLFACLLVRLPLRSSGYEGCFIRTNAPKTFMDVYES